MFALDFLKKYFYFTLSLQADSTFITNSQFPYIILTYHTYVQNVVGGKFLFEIQTNRAIINTNLPIGHAVDLPIVQHQQIFGDSAAASMHLLLCTGLYFSLASCGLLCSRELWLVSNIFYLFLRQIILLAKHIVY